MAHDVEAEFLTRVERGLIDPDPAQQRTAGRLDLLAAELARSGGKGRGAVRSLFQRGRAVPRGIYLCGEVGRGKTMLMDLYFTVAKTAPKQRWHFHAFMSAVHERIGEARKGAHGDPMPAVAASIAAEARLLCLDELHVTDIADAMILGRLFTGLFERGVVAVATSNSPPDQLYWNGLNRQLFLPFIELIAQHMEVVELLSAKDYRLDKLSLEQLYITPAGPAATAALDLQFQRLTGEHTPGPQHLEVKGRKLHVPQAAAGVARFCFDDLCRQPLGPLDYLHIAHAFHTVVVDGIPVLSPDERNEARRFIHLIDTLYDRRVCLIASAGAEPAHLYPKGEGSKLFERTASRLIEMRSDAYLSRK